MIFLKLESTVLDIGPVNNKLIYEEKVLSLRKQLLHVEQHAL